MALIPPFPSGIATTTLTGRYLDPEGNPLQGTLVFTPPTTLTLPNSNTVSMLPASVTLDANGMFSVQLISTDNANMSPINWTYQVQEYISATGSAATTPGRRYNIFLPQSPSTVDITAIAPRAPYAGSYMPFVGPAGGDLASNYPNPTVAKINGVAISGTPSVGQELKATSPTAATWQTPAHWVPGDQSLLLATADPQYASSTWAPTGSAASGIVYLTKLVLRVPTTLTTLWVSMTGSAGGAAVAGNFFGIYDALTGTLQAVTADQVATFNAAAGVRSAAFTTPYAAPAGTYFIACLLNGTWGASTLALAATGGNTSANANLSAPGLRYSNLLTGRTTLPASLTLSAQVTTAITAGAGSQWYGIS